MAHQEGVDTAAAARAIREPPRPKQKRVYKTVTVDGPPYRVFLDGKPLSTPLRRPVIAPSRAMAEAVAAEWDAQVSEIDPASMPVMRLVATCIDKVQEGRSALVDELMAHVDADLICYRAAGPAELKARQARLWQPVVDWAAGRIGAEIRAGEGLMPFAQPVETAIALRRIAQALDDWRFTALQAAAGITGSILLALAMTEGRLGAADAFAAALLDELYQQERWGADPLAKARQDGIKADLEGVGRYLGLL